MNDASRSPLGPDYGLDAPGVVRNLLVIGGASLLTGLAAYFGVWSGGIGRVHFTGALIGIGLGMTPTGLYMIWSSRVGKIRHRERMLDQIKWRGDEQVLDVGCGRGLMLIGAAKRLTTGKATGIDIWQSEDLSDNRPDATMENARREGVADRVELKTADMRSMPFDDASFDVVVSSWAIHNLYEAKDRDQAIAEIARVLKPGGVAVIKDIRHIGQYADGFARHGCADVRSVSSAVAGAVATVLTFGSIRPGTLVVR